MTELPWRDDIVRDLLGAVLRHATSLLEGLWAALGAARWAVVAFAVIAVVRRARRVRWRRRDPMRLFNARQRADGRMRAAGRCEYAQPWSPWRRCTGPAQESDHFWPWSRGGATSMPNLVAACHRHNRSKGGRMPSTITAWWIARRRRDYFPADAPRRPGIWYR